MDYNNSGLFSRNTREFQHSNIQQIVERFAPQVKISSKDPWNPVSVEWFIERCSLYKRKKICRFLPAFYSLIEKNPTVSSIYQNKSICASNFTKRNPNWLLSLNSKSYYSGMSNEQILNGEAPVYVNILRVSEKYIDLQYFFFFAFNGSLYNKFPFDFIGAHQGDWEHITVRIDAKIFENYNEKVDSPIKAIFYSRHDPRMEGFWYFNQKKHPFDNKDNGYWLLENSFHPIVYCGKGGHSSYTQPYSTQKRFVPFGFHLGFLDDQTDSNGIIWNTWKNCIILDSEKENQKWLFFSGLWGSNLKYYFSSDGPYGPKMKMIFTKGDFPPYWANSIKSKEPSNLRPLIYTAQVIKEKTPKLILLILLIILLYKTIKYIF